MVLLSMSCPCSWGLGKNGLFFRFISWRFSIATAQDLKKYLFFVAVVHVLVPDGAVVPVFPLLLMSWSRHFSWRPRFALVGTPQDLRNGSFFGKVLQSYTFLCQMVLLSMSCPCSWCLGKVSLLLTFLCLDFQLVQVIVLEIIYICLWCCYIDSWLSIFELAHLKIWENIFFSLSSYMLLSHLALLSMSCPWWSRPPLWTRGSCATICCNNQPVQCTLITRLISKSVGQWVDASCNKTGLWATNNT